jgi:carbon storage regulator
MLVLTRKKSESIWIGESILLTVVELSKGEVRLAFEAPPDVSIDREEVRARRREPLPLPQKANAIGAGTWICEGDGK